MKQLVLELSWYGAGDVRFRSAAHSTAGVCA